MLSWLTFAVFFINLQVSQAEKLEDVEAAQKKSYDQYIERFSVFTQEPDVMGKAAKPDGSTVKGGRKTKFNEDDGNPFQSPHFTEHNYMFDMDDTAFNKKQADRVKAGAKIDPEKELLTRVIYSGTSPHGELSDSSEIERKDGQLNKKFNIPKTEADRKKEKDEKIEYRGMIVREKKEIKKQVDEEGNITDLPSDKNNNATAAATPANPNAPASGKKREETFTLFRDKLRDEARETFEKVGTDGFKPLESAAKGPEGQNNENLLPDPEFLIEGANRAYKAWDANDMAKLGQRRFVTNFGSGEKMSPDEALSEDIPTCEKLSQVKLQKFQQDDKLSKEAKEAKIKELEEEKKQCTELAATTYRDINPRFIRDKKDKEGKKKLQNMGVTQEDGKERDYRVGLNLRKRVGKKIKNIQSEWQYAPEDEKAEITIGYDEQGKASVKKKMSLGEQVQLYNDDLQGAAEDIKKIQSVYPDFKVTEQEILANQIQLGQRSTDQITKIQSQYEDFSAPVITKDDEATESYEQLLKKNSK